MVMRSLRVQHPPSVPPTHVPMHSMFFCIPRSPAISCPPLIFAFSIRPLWRRSMDLRRAARQETGFPPKVDACSGMPVHKFSICDHGPERHAGSNPLGKGDYVRFNAEMFHSEHFSLFFPSRTEFRRQRGECSIFLPVCSVLHGIPAAARYIRPPPESVRRKWPRPLRRMLVRKSGSSIHRTQAEPQVG